jgi:hypothetical protein
MDAMTFWTALAAIAACVMAVVALLAHQRDRKREKQPSEPSPGVPPPGYARAPNTPVSSVNTTRNMNGRLQDLPSIVIGDSRGFPLPLAPERVLGSALGAQVRAILVDIPAEQEFGGITVGRPPRPRALIYLGPCGKGVDARIREVVRGHGFQVAAVRDPEKLHVYATASAENPLGY